MRTAGRLLVALLVGSVVAAGCARHSGQDQASPSITPSISPSVSPSASPVSGKFPLGSLTVLSGADSCGAGRSCRIEYEVSCPAVKQTARGALVVTPAQGVARGLVGILLGGMGTGFTGVNRMFVSQLASDGFEVVVVSWEDPWLQSARGEEVGPARLACRSATAIRWMHDHLYEQLGAPRAGLGACGFCLHGNSGGASQIGYSLSLYGLGSIVDAAVLSGGPPHAAMAKGCLREKGFTYDNISTGIIDSSYGFLNGGGPCEKHDGSFQNRWNQDSLDTAGGVYRFPKTRVAFVFVSGDPTVGPAHGREYQAKLAAAHSPYLTVRTVSGQGHTIQELPQGRAALESALLGSARS